MNADFIKVERENDLRTSLANLEVVAGEITESIFDMRQEAYEEFKKVETREKSKYTQEAWSEARWDNIPWTEVIALDAHAEEMATKASDITETIRASQNNTYAELAWICQQTIELIKLKDATEEAIRGYYNTK